MADWTNLPDQLPFRAAPATWANAVRDNPIAIAQGAPGAPRLQSGAYGNSSIPFTALGPSSVRRSHIHTAVQQVSRSGSGITHFTLTGGEWNFWPELSLPGSGENNVAVAYARPGHGGDASTAARLTLQKEAGGTGTQTATIRYLPGSPPYDLGDGEVAGFAYASMAPDGAIISFALAPDPPWYGLPAENDDPVAEFVAGRINRAEMVRRCQDRVKARAEPEGMEAKLCGMAWRPHPIEHEDPARPVIMLDPMAPLLRDLLAIADAGGDLGALIEAGALRIDSDGLKRRRHPPGVPAHAVRWR